MTDIDGVVVKPLRWHPDHRGKLMELVRVDDPSFRGFGQTYVTTTYPGVVKAWHCHRLQTDSFICIKGLVRLVAWDGRPDSATRGALQHWCIGEHHPLMVQIPPGVMHGWKALGTEEAWVINVVTHPYNHAEPDEIRLDPHDNEIPWDWAHRDG